jgi:protein TonB
MPRHRRFTTHPGSTPEPPENFSLTPFALGLAAAGESRFPPSPARKTWHLEWPAAFLLHAAIIALALISFVPQMSIEPPSQNGVSVVFQNGRAQQTTAPPSQFRGPPTLAQSPPSSSPPPPPPAQVSPLAPETNLEIPEDLFSEMPLPPPAAQAQQQVQNTRPVQHHYVPHRQYQVMSGMSLGNQSSPNAQPPLPNGFHGLNTQLSQSDLNAMEAPEFSVQGEIGADWMSGFNKWVNAHIYYPQAAAEQNQQGTSVIQFTVHRDGHVTGVHLLSSAGSTFLDQAWLGIFLQNTVPPFPPGTKSDSINITASLQYEIVP